MPDSIKEDFFNTYNLSESEFIQKVYKKPGGNRFLASFTPFLYKHRENSHIHELLINNFADFFSKNIETYDRKDLPVHFVGSIAWYFQKELQEAAQLRRLHIGKIIQAPINDIANYHINEYEHILK